MQIEIVDGQTVRACLSMETCIELMAETMKAQCQQRLVLPQRTTISLFEPTSLLMTMPGALQSPAVAGVKAITLNGQPTSTPNPDNSNQALPAIQGLILLFDLETGTPIAIVDAASITRIRTAAATAAATAALAREDARSLTIIGTGVQAEAHVRAILAIRPIREISVWGRSLPKAQALVERIQPTIRSNIKAETDIANAVEQADIICTVTCSSTPLVEGRWLRPGVHINLVGAHSPTAREVDSETIRRSRLFVEQKSAALKEAGDLLIPLQNNEISIGHLQGEIGQVLLGEIPGRTSNDQITAYKSLGNAAQDLAAASAALTQARQFRQSKIVAMES